jgi:hypothetical protein
MKTRKLLQITGLIIVIMLSTTSFTNAQIPIQGLVSDNEGVASWDADGSGPEPEAYGHQLPFGWGSSYYYAASLDHINTNQDAAMAHCLHNITGFPQFVQALSDNGFAVAQVKITYSMTSQLNDKEGEDWFNIDDIHYFNRYNGSITIELNGEPMIFAYINFNNIRGVPFGPFWATETNFTTPFNISAGSSPAVQDVAEAFITDLNGEEIRMITFATAQNHFEGNGRDGYTFDISSGYLEKGLPELSFEGIKADHEGMAVWNSDGTGPEPPRIGHSFIWNGLEYGCPYYAASRDYDSIDPDPDACAGHYKEGGKGFPNLAIQLAYRGYTIGQLKAKIDTLTLGNDIQGEDWGIDTANNIHWYNYYGGNLTIELAGEPILASVKDTSFSHDTLVNYSGWSQYCNYINCRDISSGASADAKHIAKSFLKDLCGHSLMYTMKGEPAYELILDDGRIGNFHNVWGSMVGKQPTGTHIWGPEVSGTWNLAGSPYIIMGYIIIPDGETLEIEPGVEVKFNSIARFDVQGCLKAIGAYEEPIIFTAVDDDIPWGGIFFDETPTANDTSKFLHCIFEYAYGYEEELGYNCGGAIAVNKVDKMIISNCTFRHNRADNVTGNTPAGGALAIFSSSFPVTHCIFHDNIADYGGAMIIDINSHPDVDNCLFYNNESISRGGAVFVYEFCNPHFINCTFAGNHAFTAGGAFELEIGGETTFTNCIFWDNSADTGPDQINIWPENPPSLNLYYCDIEGGMDGITPGFSGDTLGILDTNPEFIAQDDYLYVLGGSSPCIDKGTLDPPYLPENWICPETCLCGNERVLYGGIDLGCYEWASPGGEEEINGIQDLSVNIYPNPVNTLSTIEFTSEHASSIKVLIYDICGRKVYASEVTETHAGISKITVNVKDLPAGLYFYRLKTGNQMITKKVIKY